MGPVFCGSSFTQDEEGESAGEGPYDGNDSNGDADFGAEGHAVFVFLAALLGWESAVLFCLLMGCFRGIWGFDLGDDDGSCGIDFRGSVAEFFSQAGAAVFGFGALFTLCWR
jgi:hypothetical protein